EDGWLFSCCLDYGDHLWGKVHPQRKEDRHGPRVAQKFAVVISGTRPVESNVRAPVALALHRLIRAGIRDRTCAGIPIAGAEDTTLGGFVADAGGSVFKAVIVAASTVFTFFSAVNVV